MHERIRTSLLWGLTVIILGSTVCALYATGFFSALYSKEALAAYIDACTPWSHLVYFGIQLVSVIIAPIPSNITAAVGGVLFGMIPAFLLTWAAVVAGSLIVFGLARLLGQGFANQLVGKKLSEKYLDVIRRKRDTFLLLAFLFPFFPDDLLCILAGLTDISWKRFLFLCLIARPWGLLVACAVGGSVLHIPLGGMILLGLAGLAVFLLAMKYGDKVEAAILRRMKK